jgi:hypothetical protein
MQLQLAVCHCQASSRTGQPRQQQLVRLRGVQRLQALKGDEWDTMME